MPKTTKAMPSFEGVAAGQTATLRLPIGQTYHQLLIKYSGMNLADITGLRLVGNGKAIHVYQNLSRLDVMNRFEGRAGASGIIVLDLERYGLEGRNARELTAIGTGHPKDPTPLTTLALEVDIASTATVVDPALSVKANRSAPVPLGFIKKIRRFTYNASASGEYEIADLPKGEIINQVFFFGPGIEKVELQRDNYQEFVRTAAENSLIHADSVRVPQAGVYVYDPTEHGNGSETLATRGVQDLRFTLSMAAPATIDVVVVYVGPLNG